jgi:hypothetical protein
MGALLWIGLGLAFLLQNFRIGPDVWFLGLRYWPVILILIGLGKIADYFIKKDVIAVRFGELVLLLLVFLIGSAATRLSEGNLGRIFRTLPIEMGNLLIQPETWMGESHTYMEEAVYPFESRVPIRIENSNGKVLITPGTDREIRVRLRKAIYGEESRTRIIAGEIHLETASEGVGPVNPELDPKSKQAFVIRTNRNALSAKNYRYITDMEILVPKNSQLQVKNSFGEIRVAQVNGNLNLSTTHKSIDVQDCTGQFDISARYSECRLANLVGNVKLEGRGKVHLENIKGDVAVTNEYSPLEIYDVDGKLDVSSTESNLTIEGATKPVVINGRGSRMRIVKLKDSLKITTSYQNIEISDIASDVTLETRYASLSLKGVKGNVLINSNTDRINADDIGGRFTVRAHGSQIGVNNIRGPLDIQTSLKEVLVSDFADSCTIENSYGSISISTQTLGKGNITLKNRAGMIDVHIPEGSAFDIEATARNGKIASDFPELQAIQNYSGTGMLKSKLRGGGPKILLETEYSNIDIHNAPRNTAEP